jgi:hypothetical protein
MLPYDARCRRPGESKSRRAFDSLCRRCLLPLANQNHVLSVLDAARMHTYKASERRRRPRAFGSSDAFHIITGKSNNVRYLANKIANDIASDSLTLTTGIYWRNGQDKQNAALASCHASSDAAPPSIDHHRSRIA